MGVFGWLTIAGIIMLAITLFIKNHTYSCECEWDSDKREYVTTKNKIRIPMWAMILIWITAFIPVINIAVFTTGIIGWGTHICTGDIAFCAKENSMIDRVIKFLCKEV